jgi:hypothetical protein
VICFGNGPTQALQRVRLPRESLANRSANCIDSTVLMASVLEAASLNAGIVLVPGHAFLAFEKKENSGQWGFVEGTMLGSHDFPAALEQGELEAQQYSALAKQPGKEDVFQLLPIPALRTQLGILPME